eukprot:GHVL01015616.1.p1 GENE.GHVL01015616.1~~GHVL01015616.1.p1  ORF type:complete len:289 (-),score=47.26 GHVL01015616.1:202-1068(-)
MNELNLDIRCAIDCIVQLPGVCEFLKFLKPVGDDCLSSLAHYCEQNAEIDPKTLRSPNERPDHIKKTLKKLIDQLDDGFDVSSENDLISTSIYNQINHVLLKMSESEIFRMVDKTKIGFFVGTLERIQFEQNTNNYILPCGKELSIIAWFNSKIRSVFVYTDGMWQRPPCLSKSITHSEMATGMNKKDCFHSIGLYIDPNGRSYDGECAKDNGKDSRDLSMNCDSSLNERSEKKHSLESKDHDSSSGGAETKKKVGPRKKQIKIEEKAQNDRNQLNQTGNHPELERQM